MEKLFIEIPTGHIAAAEFVEWLRAQVHDAELIDRGVIAINGVTIDKDKNADRIYDNLWCDFVGR